MDTASLLWVDSGGSTSLQLGAVCLCTLSTSAPLIMNFSASLSTVYGSSFARSTAFFGPNTTILQGLGVQYDRFDFILHLGLQHSLGPTPRAPSFIVSDRTPQRRLTPPCGAGSSFLETYRSPEDDRQPRLPHTAFATTFNGLSQGSATTSHNHVALRL